MRKFFWIGFFGLLVFEIANVYFIMPMPGSQQMNSLDAAHFLYKWRWVFRLVFGLMILIGLFRGRWHRRWKWALILPVAILAAVIYMANFQAAADKMFRVPNQLLFASATENKVDSMRLVIGVTINGEAKAYPIQYIGYHHHLQDSVGGKAILVTYCTVCRTGRVFEPFVRGKRESFRLVGMDHFNAMLEDATTGSWWQQATGEAVTGKLKGEKLPEVLSVQTSLTKWLNLYPNSLIMQADPNFVKSYDTSFKYESGASKSRLTGTDSSSWKDKSWVIGVKSGTERKVFDWNQLVKDKVIHDTIQTRPLAVVLSNDQKSFFAFRLPTFDARLSLQNDTIIYNGRQFRLNGTGIDTTASFEPLQAYQEFWHSWRTFNQ